MGNSSAKEVTVQGVKCKPYEVQGKMVIDLRPVGFLEESSLRELLGKKHQLSKILLCCDDVVSFVRSTIDNLPSESKNMTIEVFGKCDKTNTSGQKFGGKYLWRTGDIRIDKEGDIFVDLNCKSLKNRRELRFCPWKKIKELSLTGLGECFELEKLDIFCFWGCCLKQPVNLPKSQNLTYIRLFNCGLERLPVSIHQYSNVKFLSLSFNERLGDQAVSLEGLKSLERLEECAALRELAVTGPANVGIELEKICLKLPKLQELRYNGVVYERRETGFVSRRGVVFPGMHVPFKETTSDDHGEGLSSDLVVQPEYPSINTEETVTFQDITPLIEERVNCIVSEACEPGRAERILHTDLVVQPQYLSSNTEKVVTFQEMTPLIEERVDRIVSEASEPGMAEKLLFGDSFRLIETRRVSDRKKISYAYTYHASVKDHLTVSIRKSMTSDVKKQAYASLFVGNESQQGDQGIFNLVRERCLKNASTARPAWLLPTFARYCKSIGQISCGQSQGTCFLVTSNVIITCYHVLLDFNEERTESNDPNLQIPVKVTFDFSGQASTEVEVDMTGPRIYSAPLDYVFLSLHQSFGDGVGLGHLVRNHAVTDNVVTIIGYPERTSMTEETCVVVRNDEKEALLKERIRKVHPNLHTFRHRIMSAEYDERLAYDSSLFRGSSGSPVFNMNGHVVALHCQGYPLKVEGREYSVMEFGVHFSAICEDLRQRFPADLSELFPLYDKPLEMDTDEMYP